MSKRLHLICNAHLDPVWQWEWEEGAAEALSTFRIAADFCEEYDSFVFCHNEALLYEWIEEYDPALFEHIRTLVKKGKWHIMGGWHLQPDCNMPSGEGFVRQILAGRKYFLEKFGVAPRVAVNVDPFGHSRGLVQILSKSGYDGYLFMRPDENFITLPASDFKWVGYDGSEVTAVRIHGGYNSGKGKAAEKVRAYVDKCAEGDFFLCLWGIGNHGGGPSKKDLDDLEVLTKEMEAQGVSLIHSTPEQYIDEVNQKRSLPTFDKGLKPWAVGCYTSQVRIKQRYRQTENTFLMTEAMASHAMLEGLMTYPEKELAEALYDLLTVQFHDILPGSSIQPAEEMGLRMLDHALELLSRVKARAFFALAAGQPKASPDKIPIFAYNPYPYPVESDLTAEFMLWDQNWNPEFLSPRVFSENGTLLPSQCEKEYSTIPLEWRKRVVFRATLAPMTLNRFDCGFEAIPAKPIPTLAHNDTHYVFDAGSRHVEINRSTGLVDVYRVDEKDYVTPGAFALEVFEDNFDPWYMVWNSWKNKLGAFSLLSPEEAQAFCHTDAPIAGVHIIESGDVHTVVEAVFGYNSARAQVKYILSENEDMQIDVRIVWDEKQRLVKLNVPAAFAGECIGEQAYGREALKDDMDENVSQRYIALCQPEAENALGLAVINNGLYGSSFDGANHSLKITLLRSASYTAHPLGDRVVMPQDRYMPYIEQGERDFSFKLVTGSRTEVLDHAPRAAALFNRRPMVLSFYPTGVGEKPKVPFVLENTDIITVEAFKKAEHGEGYILRLFNPTEKPQAALAKVYGASLALSFGAFEIKTLRYADGVLCEDDLMEGLLK